MTLNTLSTSTKILDINLDDYDRVVELNESEVQWTSPMDQEQLEGLLLGTCYAKVIKIAKETAGFLIAMDQSADYDNGNFDWFRRRYDRFCYIDRIVIDIGFAGQGLGPVFYKDIFDFARTEDLKRVVCEYNIEPLNEPSMKFHERLGFSEVGRRKLEQKTVSMQLMTLNQS